MKTVFTILTYCVAGIPVAACVFLLLGAVLFGFTKKAIPSAVLFGCAFFVLLVSPVELPVAVILLGVTALLCAVFRLGGRKK